MKAVWPTDTTPSRLALIQDVLMSLPAAVAYLAGPDLVIGFANDAYRRLAGGRDVDGLPLRQALPELAAEGRLGLLEQVAKTGEAVRGTEAGLWVQRPGGRAEQVFIDYICQPVREADGSIVGILLYAADVTAHVRDRQRLEELAGDLAASQERYRTLFETMPQGVLHYDADVNALPWTVIWSTSYTWRCCFRRLHADQCSAFAGLYRRQESGRSMALCQQDWRWPGNRRSSQIGLRLRSSRMRTGGRGQTHA